jgi:hypothetical protein
MHIEKNKLWYLLLIVHLIFFIKLCLVYFIQFIFLCCVPIFCLVTSRSGPGLLFTSTFSRTMWVIPSLRALWWILSWLTPLPSLFSNAGWPIRHFIIFCFFLVFWFLLLVFLGFLFLCFYFFIGFPWVFLLYFFIFIFF